ncbi:hypothetical protein QQ045_023590 [Rhodiola kirilowii]
MATIILPPLQASSSSTARLLFYASIPRPPITIQALSNRRISSLFSPSVPVAFSITTTKCRPRTLIVVSALPKLGDTESIAVPDEAVDVIAKFPQEGGVYAVYDKDSELQFIGITRNIAASVVTHQKSVPELCSSVRACTVDEPDRTTLTQAWKTWMEEHISTSGKVPPGNETGNSTWVRQPPRKKSDLRLTPGRHVQLTVPLEELIDKLVKENKVVAFIKGSRSAPQCGFSQRVVGILESEGIDYESVNVLDEENNPGLREALKSYSNWPTFPQIFANGELVGGCDILNTMHEKGELTELRKT